MIKVPKDNYGNDGWAVKARTSHWCEAKRHDCSRLIEPGQHYFRAIAWPDGDINTGSVPWVMKICRNCLHDEQRAMFDRAIRKAGKPALRIIEQGTDVLVLGTDQIIVAARFAGLDNDKGIFWGSSSGGLLVRRNRRWEFRSDYMPPKDARPGVMFHSVRRPSVSGGDRGQTT